MGKMAPPASHRPLVGIGWMVATGPLFVGVAMVVKHLGDALPPPQAAFLRYALGLVFFLPMMPAIAREVAAPRPLALYTLRGALHGLGVIGWFYAMTQITLAEVTALGYLNPVMVTVGAALLLGERLALRRTLAVVAALAGVLVILRPGLRAVEAGHLVMLVTATCFAGSYLLAKPLSARAPPEVIVAMLSVVVTVVLAPFAAASWVTPRPADLAWLMLVAAFATGGHYAMTRAFRAAPISATQPVIFLQLVWATAMGALVFGEAVDPFVVAGGTIIVAAVSFIAWREAVLRRRVSAGTAANEPAGPPPAQGPSAR